MPHVVAGQEDDFLVGIAEHRSIILNVADRAEIVDLPFLTELDVAGLRLPEAAGERELAFVVERLIREMEEGMRVDRGVGLRREFSGGEDLCRQSETAT